MKRVKRFGNIGLIFMLICMNVCPSVSLRVANAESKGEEKVIFESNFDNDELGETPSGFNVLEEGGTVRVVEDLDTGNKNVLLDDTSDEKFVLLEKTFDDLTGIEIGRASCRE